MKPNSALVLSALLCTGLAAQSQDRPNILWISVEDISAHLGCYGDSYAHTPHLDQLAKEGVRFDNAFATIGVCAPARSTLITGMYPPSIGSQHMRCTGKLPKGVRGFPTFLREAGYYCTNNSKTDYNLKIGEGVWHESSRRAHWRKRKKGQPFFAVFNITVCHESKIRMPERQYAKRTADFTAEERHDPAKVSVPPYHPNTPETRKDWARYADIITLMDKQVGKRLAELVAARLDGNTIVVFFSDHGAGMPRSKRWLYDSSLKVPMIVRFPKKWRHLAGEGMSEGKPGSATDRLVSFVDFAPTMLSLIGVEIPEYMQGKAFLGEKAVTPRTHVFGFRDRMDERYDMLRCVRDKRFKYIRNFMPHRPWAQHISYMFEMPTMQVWQRMFAAGELNAVQKRFFERKPTEELYDTTADPHETKNLAADPEHKSQLESMRGTLENWMGEIRDLGLLPESELRTRFAGAAPYDAVRANADSYAFDRIFNAADAASRSDASGLRRLTRRLTAKDPAVRYWAAVGCAQLGKVAAPAKAALLAALADPSADVRVAVAEALTHLGATDKVLPVLAETLASGPEWGRLRAINLIDRLDEKAASLRPALEKAATDKNKYVVRVARKALRDLL